MKEDEDSMTILNRYLTRLFLAMLSVTVPGLAGIYLLVHFMENVDDFLEAGAPAAETVRYFLLLIPGLVYETAPLSILLAALLSTMLITRNMEMLALRSSGIAPRTIARPFFITTALLSALLLLMNIFLIPRARSMAAAIRKTSNISGGGSLIGNSLFYRGPDSILKAETLNSEATRLKNVRWFMTGSDCSLKGMIAARHARFRDGAWHFSHGVRVTEGPEAKFFKNFSIKANPTPGDLAAIRKPAEEMGIPELFNIVIHMKRAGLPCGDLETVLWSSLLYPFLSLLLLMTGLPITISRIKGAISQSLGLGMAMGLATWVLWNLALVLGRSGAVPGFLAPLAVEAAMGATGIWVMRKFGFNS